jgi:hypothetical protein
MARVSELIVFDLQRLAGFAVGFTSAYNRGGEAAGRSHDLTHAYADLLKTVVTCEAFP